ncbi:MAG: hypothetical protein Q9217_000518 [Psora testacea]
MNDHCDKPGVRRQEEQHRVPIDNHSDDQQSSLREPKKKVLRSSDISALNPSSKRPEQGHEHRYVSGALLNGFLMDGNPYASNLDVQTKTSKRSIGAPTDKDLKDQGKVASNRNQASEGGSLEAQNHER